MPLTDATARPQSGTDEPDVLFVCLNPALDRTVSVPGLDRGSTLRATDSVEAPGGKAIHAAVVAAQIAGPARIVAAVGGESGLRVKDLLDLCHGINMTPIWIEDTTRETWTVVPEDGGPSLEVALPPPRLNAAEVADIWHEIERSAPHALLIGGGSLPLGVQQDFYRRLTDVGRDLGTRVLLDTAGSALEHGVKARPYLVKPNFEEARNLLGLDSVEPHPETGVDLALAIQEMGAENVWLTLGSMGSILLTADGEITVFDAAPASVVNTVGCGDAMMGALAGALADGEDLVSAAGLGVAAAASQAEQLSPVGIDVDRIHSAVQRVNLHPLPEGKER